ncbi:hypothetical protein V3C10_04215 [[Clostridium] symbiosum]|uniref:hypothetical protein n=1 Tax=Clostridium symbiosum TaxID=1512 RepID=UPI001D06C06A|nr:hypothetical protein [[Clostridium] symbiosum]MCB6610211.1 hypothetical protein [[Clostridium] symbiosum]MCB6933547.1 hypothetical protein [[Clostridium] symbiosum]
MSDFNNQKIVIARKEHKCEFCKKLIQPGQKYSYETGVYDGDFYTRKLCPECFGMLNKFCKANGYGEFSWDWITEWLQDLYCYSCPNKEECGCSPEQCDVVRGNFSGTFTQVN